MESYHKVSVIHRASFRTHKEKETISSCQDGFKYDPVNSCFAIADGATQSFYPSIWAELLVDYFCKNPDINQDNWQGWLQPVQEKWLETVKRKVEKAKNDENPVWIDNQNRLNRFESATSTFIGLQFIDNQAKVSIIGDSCLFIFRGEQLIQTYLLTSSTDFNYRPEYFGSRPKNNDYKPKILNIELNYKQFSEKLYFVLATDALAEYIFKCTEQQREILTTLLNIDSDTAFEDFVASARHDNTIKMKNDDVTLMILEISDHEIVNYPISPIGNGKEVQEDYSTSSSPSSTKHSGKEDESDSSNLGENSQNNSDQTLDSSSGFATIISTLRLKISRYFPMTPRNPRRSSTSSHQSKQVKPSAIKGIDGIRNILLLGLPLNLVLTTITLHYNLQTFKKINDIKPEIQGLSNQIQGLSNQIQSLSESRKIEQGTIIYEDQNLQQIIIPSLSNSVEVLISEEDENSIKFTIDIYAHNSILDQCSGCESNEIEIQPKRDLRTFPSTSKGDIFGQLSKSSKFEKLEFNSFPNWYKLKFVGYIKK